MSMKHSAMFDQNPLHTLDQIVAEHIPMKNYLKPCPNVKVIAKISRYQSGEQKTMPQLKQRRRVKR